MDKGHISPPIMAVADAEADSVKEAAALAPLPHSLLLPPSPLPPPSPPLLQLLDVPNSIAHCVGALPAATVAAAKNDPGPQLVFSVCALLEWLEAMYWQCASKDEQSLCDSLASARLAASIRHGDISAVLSSSDRQAWFLGAWRSSEAVKITWASAVERRSARGTQNRESAASAGLLCSRRRGLAHMRGRARRTLVALCMALNHGDEVVALQ